MTLSVPWVPLSVLLPEKFVGATTALTLDGQPWSDPVAVLRKRSGIAGGGADYLAMLDLGALATGPHQVTLEATATDGERVKLVRNFKVEVLPVTVRLHVVDADGAPIGARVAIWGADHLPLNLAGPDAGAVDPLGRDTAWQSVLAPHGEATLFMSPGQARFVAVRGPRDGVSEALVELAAPANDITLVVPRLIDTPGQISADLHVHTAHSGDAFTPVRARYEALLAADLDAVVITDHERIIDPKPEIAAAGGGPLASLPGVEVLVGERRHSQGHLNVFPLNPGDRVEERSEDPAFYLGRYREIAKANPFPGAEGAVLLQLNHPRGIQFKVDSAPIAGAHALFTAKGYDRKLAPGQGSNAWMLTPNQVTGARPVDFDAIEVLNRFSWALYRQTRSDWIALWRHGLTLTGTGNSDSHALAVETVGFPYNLITGPSPDQDPAGFVAAIAAGRLSVSNGPIVEMVVSAGDARATPGDLISSRRVHVSATVRAAPWVPVPELRLIVGGEIHQTQALTGTDLERGRLELDLDLETDTWLFAEAGWSLLDDHPAPGGLYAELAPGHVPIGFTNPVRVDADGDGRWTAPLAR